MTVLNKKNKWKAPFFGKSNDYTTGRDPLGLQTTSQASYGALLPGLTNLTNRIRYYGFYCWLLELYAKKIRNTNYKEQYKFIRRAELTIATIMQYEKPEITQIPGSSYAYYEIQKNKLDFFDISKGADIENKNTYWKYSSGAFGQYYSGALKTLGLILTRENEKTFICSRDDENIYISGLKLSEAFNENIENKALNIFFDSIQNGKLLKKDIKYLFESFSIIKIVDNSTEKDLYTELLLGNDYPVYQTTENKTYFRRDTILLMLKHIKYKDDVSDFDLRFIFEHIYNTQGKDYSENKTDASYGWYYYQFNEYWHFAVETIFWSILNTLEAEYSEVNLQKFIDDFLKTTTIYLIENKFINSIEQELLQVITNINDDELSISEEIRKAIKINNSEQAMYLGVKLLLLIFKNNETELDKLREFAFQNNMERDGDCVRNIKSFNNSKEKKIVDFLHKFLIKNVINRHIYVVYRKLGSGVKNTLKFSYEDNIIRLIQKIEPVWTTPRIYALNHFLQDLDLIDKKGDITLAGEKLLSE